MEVNITVEKVVVEGQKSIDAADLEAILSVDVDGWKSAIPEIRDHLSRFEPKIPAALPAAVDRLEAALT